MTIWFAGVVTLLGALSIFVITGWLLYAAGATEPAESVIPRLYLYRGRYFVGLTATIIALLFATFSVIPYQTRTSAEPEYIIPVTGRLWLWEFGPLQDGDGNPVQAEGSALVVPVGAPLEFHVTAADVNHSFGLYNVDGELLTQTQAMPGYENRLAYTFREPGTYHVLCLEYCGLAHHVMATTITAE